MVPKAQLMTNNSGVSSRDPYLSECCGHVFCKSCVERVKRRTAAAICPMCRSEDFKVFVNKQLDRITKGLCVSCTNKDKGCEWQGEMNGIDAHLGSSDGCPFQSIRCVNNVVKYYNIRTSQNISKRNVHAALFIVSFSMLQMNGNLLKANTKTYALNFLLPDQTTVAFSAFQGKTWQNTYTVRVCLLELVRCEFYTIGCTDTMSRQDQKQHNADNLHKHLTLSTCQLAKAKEMANIKQTIENGLAEIKGEFVQKLNCMEKQLTTLTKIATTQQETIGKLTEKLEKLSETVKDSKPLDGQSLDISEQKTLANMKCLSKYVK